jgi:prepilin-type processing-associated H-X9-DG protein
MAKRLVCATNLKQIDLAIRLYLDGNNDTYPCTQDPVSTNPPYWLWMGRGWRKFVEPYLSRNIDVNNPSVLLCPEDPSPEEKYESTSYSYTMAFYHSPQQIDSMNCTEKHAEQRGSPTESIPQKSSDIAKPFAKILIGEWDSNHLRIEQDNRWWCNGWWNWNGSRNYLFADGQVNFLKAKQIRQARDGCPNPNMTIHGIKGIDWP